MHEDLQRQWGRGSGHRGLIALGGLDGFDLPDGILTRQHHQLATQRAGELHAGRAGDGELRGSVDGEIG